MTLAPDVGTPPLVTDAVMEAVPGTLKLAPAIERLAMNDGGAITVAFAVPDAASEFFEALMFTAYVPGGVPIGAPLPIVTEADCPGLSVTEDDERLVDHPDGSLEPRLIALEEHAELSLLVTESE